MHIANLIFYIVPLTFSSDELCCVGQRRRGREPGGDGAGQTQAEGALPVQADRDPARHTH